MVQVADRVWYFVDRSQAAPWPALVSAVNDFGGDPSRLTVNLAAFNAHGTPFGVTQVRLLGPGEAAPETGDYAVELPGGPGTAVGEAVQRNFEREVSL